MPSFLFVPYHISDGMKPVQYEGLESLDGEVIKKWE
jgi:hypothetical protein